MEKARYNAEAELKSVSSKYEQLVKSQSASESAIINNHQEANLEQVKSKLKIFFFYETPILIGLLVLQNLSLSSRRRRPPGSARRPPTRRRTASSRC